MNKWNVKSENKETGSIGWPFLSGFKTKREATDMAKKLNAALPKFKHTVVKL